MHELTVTKNIVDIAVEEAKKAGASRIIEIRLVIGELSAIIDESVKMYFEIVSEGTMARNAKLVFKKVPAGFICKSCSNEYVKPAGGFDCPLCGGPGTLTDTGKEFYIESMDVG